MGTFDRQIAIKNDYIHFYAPGDEIFDCIVENAIRSYKGMCTAFAAQSCVYWKGFIYTLVNEQPQNMEGKLKQNVKENEQVAIGLGYL